MLANLFGFIADTAHLHQVFFWLDVLIVGLLATGLLALKTYKILRDEIRALKASSQKPHGNPV